MIICAVQVPFRDREYILGPRGRAPFGADQKEAVSGDESAGNGRTDRKSDLTSSHSVMEMCRFCFITGAQPKAGTGHKMQTVSVVFSTLHC